MESLDRLVGFWIRNVPYNLEWSTKRNNVGWRSLERVYQTGEIKGVSLKSSSELFRIVNGRKHKGRDPLLFLMDDTKQCSDVRQFFQVSAYAGFIPGRYIEGKRISDLGGSISIEVCTPEAQIALSLGPSSTNTFREEYYEDDGVQANALEALIQICVSENVSEDAITDVIDVDCVVNAIKETDMKIDYTLQEWLTMITFNRTYTNIITNKVETPAPLHYLPLFLGKYLDLSKASKQEKDAVMRAALIVDLPQLFSRIYNDEIKLWEVCHYDAVKIVKWMLTEKKADPTDDNNHPIIRAAASGNAGVVRLLLEDGRANLRDKEVALHDAALEGRTEVVRLLLDDGRADPTSYDNYSIQVAAEKGHAEVVRLLLEDGRADPTVNHNESIRIAVEEGHAEVVRLLLEDGRADPTAGNNYCIRVAAGTGQVKIVSLLLEDGRAEPDDNDSVSIRMAAEGGHTEVVRLLLENGRAEPDADDSIAIQVASYFGHTEVVKLLLKDGRADPSARYNAALSRARERGHKEIVKLLLADPRVIVPLADEYEYSDTDTDSDRDE